MRCQPSLVQLPHRIQADADGTERVRCSRCATTPRCSFLLERTAGSLHALHDASQPAPVESRSRWSSVASQRPTTAVTIPGKVLRVPIVQTASGALRRDRADLQRQFSGRSQGITANFHRSRAGMGFLSVERDRVSFDSLRPEDHAEGKSEIFQDRSLFDMQFDVRSSIARSTPLRENERNLTAAPDGIFQTKCHH